MLAVQTHGWLSCLWIAFGEVFGWITTLQFSLLQVIAPKVPCHFLPLFPSGCMFIFCVISTNSLIYPMNLEVIKIIILIPIKIMMKYAIWPAIPSILHNWLQIWDILPDMGFNRFCKNRSGSSDVMAWLGLNTLGLGLALTAQGFKNMKPKPWAELWLGLGSAWAWALALACFNLSS